MVELLVKDTIFGLEMIYLMIVRHHMRRIQNTHMVTKYKDTILCVIMDVLKNIDHILYHSDTCSS